MHRRRSGAGVLHGGDILSNSRIDRATSVSADLVSDHRVGALQIDGEAGIAVQQAIGDVIAIISAGAVNSISGVAESRGANHAIARSDLNSVGQGIVRYRFLPALIGHAI